MTQTYYTYSRMNKVDKSLKYCKKQADFEHMRLK